jgi:hypothetical protein
VPTLTIRTRLQPFRRGRDVVAALTGSLLVLELRSGYGSASGNHRDRDITPAMVRRT